MGRELCSVGFSHRWDSAGGAKTPHRIRRGRSYQDRVPMLIPLKEAVSLKAAEFVSCRGDSGRLSVLLVLPW